MLLTGDDTRNRFHLLSLCACHHDGVGYGFAELDEWSRDIAPLPVFVCDAGITRDRRRFEQVDAAGRCQCNEIGGGVQEDSGDGRAGGSVQADLARRWQRVFRNGISCSRRIAGGVVCVPPLQPDGARISAHLSAWAESEGYVVCNESRGLQIPRYACDGQRRLLDECWGVRIGDAGGLSSTCIDPGARDAPGCNAVARAG